MCLRGLLFRVKISQSRTANWSKHDRYVYTVLYYAFDTPNKEVLMSVFHSSIVIDPWFLNSFNRGNPRGRNLSVVVRSYCAYVNVKWVPKLVSFALSPLNASIIHTLKVICCLEKYRNCKTEIFFVTRPA